MRDVAACSSRHQDLDADLAVLLENQNAATVFGATSRRHETRSSRTDDDHIVEFRG